jgi:hypothetical protein
MSGSAARTLNTNSTINGSSISVENTALLNKTTVETTKMTFTKNASGLKTTNLLQAITPTANRTIYFPDADGTIALTSNIPTPAYTKYVCNLNQVGIAAPNVTILENTIGNIVWTRNAVGDYRGTLSGAFPTISKVWFSKPNTQFDAGNYGAFLSRTGPNEIQLLTTDYDQITPVDGTYSTSFEIRVYP